VPKGATVAAYMLEVFRDPKMFENPLQFDPDRKSYDHKLPSIYNAFGIGPRGCPGIFDFIKNSRLLISMDSIGVESTFNGSSYKKSTQIPLDPSIEIGLAVRRFPI